MGDYRDGKPVVPQPGRPQPSIVNVNQNINIDELAKALIEKLVNIGSTVIYKDSDNNIKDNFDNSKSLEKLANAMTIQRGNSSSNFNDLGNIIETKRDKEQTNKTIDLLKGLDD